MKSYYVGIDNDRLLTGDIELDFSAATVSQVGIFGLYTMNLPIGVNPMRSLLRQVMKLNCADQQGPRLRSYQCGSGGYNTSIMGD